jgi:phospholipid N-methyltransferase
MSLIGHVDIINETEIAGWAADDTDLSLQVYVDVLINSVRIASLRGAAFRQDLLRARIGDGYKAFRFNPSYYLRPGANVIEVRHSSTAALLKSGRATLIGVNGDLANLDSAARDQLFDVSQERWKGSEDDACLTWGAIFTGDSFLDALQQYYKFNPEHHICEIGPGYGRLLKTVLERKLPFRKYTGVELSADRVAKLTKAFPGEAIGFVHGDVTTVRLREEADLVICSSTFEHLFPDFTRALLNLLEHNLKPGGRLAIDFVQKDPSMQYHAQGFESSRAFVRMYSADEIRDLFRACGVEEVHLDSIVLGRASIGEIRRIFAFAEAGQH